jgi:hypothetical protein
MLAQAQPATAAEEDDLHRGSGGRQDTVGQARHRRIIAWARCRHAVASLLGAPLML